MPFSSFGEAMESTIKPLGLLLLSGGILLAGLLGDICCNRESDRPMGQKTIETVLNNHTDHLMSIPGVIGTAIGESEGKPCIKVFVVKKTEELQRKIPKELEGYKVVIDETGEFRPLEPK